VILLLVALGAGAGSVLRYAVASRLDSRTPWGTLAVNLVGSFLLGFLVARTPDGSTLALLGTGFCGGLTTYSALALQTADRGWRHGSAYALATVVLGVGACALGWVAGQA